MARIRVGRTEIEVPHQRGTLTAVHPFYGAASARALQKHITEAGLEVPTSTHVTSVVHALFGQDDFEAHNLMGIMQRIQLHAFTGILFNLRTQLSYWINNPQFDFRSLVDTNDLFLRIDEAYAHVPLSELQQGFVPWKQVAKHPYFIAWGGGEEGAEKLAELASKHGSKEACLWIPPIEGLTKGLIAKVATLNSGWGGNVLSVNGYNGFGGYAFGMAACGLEFMFLRRFVYRICLLGFRG